MKRYHINPKSGNVGVCSAQEDNCPFGGEENHFTSKEAARYNYEQRQTLFNEDLKPGETKLDIQLVALTGALSLVADVPYAKELDNEPIGGVLLSVPERGNTNGYYVKLENGLWHKIWVRQDGTVGVSSMPRNLRSVEGSARANDDQLFFTKLDPAIAAKAEQANLHLGRASTLVAEKLHKAWQDARIRQGWRAQPLMKFDKVTGKKLDIANTAFELLPNEWREENLESARVAIKAIGDSQEYGGELDTHVPEIIHTEWLKRATKPKATQMVPYAGLSDHEKAKDIRVLSIALKVIQESY